MKEFCCIVYKCLTYDTFVVRFIKTSDGHKSGHGQRGRGPTENIRSSRKGTRYAVQGLM